MLRCLVVLIGLLVTNGCVIMAGTPSIHPHSEIMAPTFCLHDGKSEPRAITGIAVEQGEKVNDERIEWLESDDPWIAMWEGRDQAAWALEYAPDGSDPPANSYSCITYGKAPPGYKETTPALPLTPERLYRVRIVTEDADADATMYFIIRLDSVGRPVKLEYLFLHTQARACDVQVITQR